MLIDPDNFTFRRARPDDDETVVGWFREPHVEEFWGEAATNIGDFRNAMSGVHDLFQYWVGQDNGAPFSLLITTDATVGMPEHKAPFLPESGKAWTLDVLIGPSEYIGRGIAAEMLNSFLCHARSQIRDLQIVLIDPAVNNLRAIHVYEKAGFRSVATFEPTKGAFKGQPHVLMAYKFSKQDAHAPG